MLIAMLSELESDDMDGMSKWWMEVVTKGWEGFELEGGQIWKALLLVNVLMASDVGIF